MVKISDETIRKRLQAVNQTQESVQTCSKWVLHNREMIDRIGTCWMDIYKKAADKLRIALIYVLNDIVQKAANKKDINVTSALHPHWINATGMSNVNVKKAISRCVEVLEQRNVYSSHIIEEMKSALVSRIATEKDETQSGDIDFSQMARGIDSFFKNEILTEKAREILARSSFNFRESVQSRVKDREEGVKALSDMDASRQKMASFLESVERHRQKGLKLMELMQHEKQTFNLQLRDVTVVNDAYEKFSEGIRETKQQLEIMEKSGALIGVDASSPPRDAPSPTAGDDPFLHGVDGDEATGAEDMEMDEEDAPGPSSCFLKSSKDYVASIPAVPEMDPRLQRLVNQSVSAGQMPENANIPMSSGGLNRTTLDPRQLDPRQARFFPPPQQPPPQLPQQLNFPPPMIPPPGLSPPPATIQNATQNSADQMLLIDKSQPPPQIFSMPPPQITNGNGNAVILHESVSTSHGGGTNLSPPIAIFNPSNPPPSLLAPQMQISPSSSQLSFSIPHPSIVHPPLPLNQFRTQPLYPSGQKRRNSSESADNFKHQRSAWSSSSGDVSENHRWNNEDNEGGRGAKWRSIGEGSGSGRYRH